MGNCVIKDGCRPCIQCGRVLPIEEFSAYPYVTRQGKQSVRLDSRCNQCNKDRRAEMRVDPAIRERDRAVSKAWKRANKEAISAAIRGKQQSDPIFRAMKASHQRNRKARMRAGIGPGRNDPAVLSLYAETKAIERKLAACVECDEPLELAMHVDHIIPLARGGRHTLENLRIVSARENLRKGARYAGD
jgi:5-methylcytosine-specific restriction endonuclease McrA